MKGLRRALELAYAEQVHLHAEAVEHVLVEQAVVRESRGHHPALRIEVDLVGMRRQVVLALVQACRPGEHRLARGAEAVERGAHFAQGGETAGLQLVGPEHDAADAIVLGGGVDGAHEVAHLHLFHAVARHPAHGARERVGAVLLNQRPFRRQHQHGLVVHLVRPSADEHQQEEHRQQAEEDHVDDHQPGEVDATAETTHESAESSTAARRRDRLGAARQGRRHGVVTIRHLSGFLDDCAQRSASVRWHHVWNGMGFAVSGSSRQRPFALLRQNRAKSRMAAMLRPAIKPIHMPRAPRPWPKASHHPIGMPTIQ